MKVTMTVEQLKKCRDFCEEINIKDSLPDRAAANSIKAILKNGKDPEEIQLRAQLGGAKSKALSEDLVKLGISIPEKRIKEVKDYARERIMGA